MVTSDSFDSLAATRADEILQLLSQPTRKQRLTVWQPYPRDPELRKLLGRIHTAISEARRLDAEQSQSFANARQRACQFLHADPRGLRIDAALEMIDGWDQLLIEHADKRYVCELLAVEFTRDRTDTTATTWSGVFGEKPSEETVKDLAAGRLMDGDDHDTKLAAARNQLAALYRTRSILYDLHRARLIMKARHLWLLSPVLVVLIGAFAASIALAGGNWRVTLLAALAGGVGAGLSGAFKLRDQVRNINDLRAFRPALVVQPLLGAAAGLFLLLVLESGLLSVKPGWAGQGAVAFVAGFSEPFFLGIVNRVAEINEERPAPEAAAGRPVGSQLRDEGGSRP